MPLDSYSQLDAVGRMRLLMRQSTEATLEADIEALLLPALLQMPEEERAEAMQRCTASRTILVGRAETCSNQSFQPCREADLQQRSVMVSILQVCRGFDCLRGLIGVSRSVLILVA